jgi:uncharacterized protein YycO
MMYVLNYRGRSLISRAIQAVTWSRYSHTALADSSGVTIEAWHRGGVDMAANPWSNHTPGTPITVYSLRQADPAAAGRIWQTAQGEIGKEYDFKALLGFLPGVRLFWKDDPDKWFCSHLVAWACAAGGCPLFSPQTPLYKISPGDIDYASPLQRIGEAATLEEFRRLVKYKQNHLGNK